MSDPLTELDQLCTRIREAETPTDRATAYGQALAAIPRVQSQLRQGRQAEILLMRESGLTDAEIGELLGLHWARVSAIRRGVTSSGSEKRRRKPAEPEPGG
ncbi:hypothetical protein ABZ949_02070 [Micromonospora tulbaghiae]|uniref:hypothetical protein n=1 Tax=Micromonospora tulbaghiae TaxID=479978 RepID=UPI0033D15DBB